MSRDFDDVAVLRVLTKAERKALARLLKDVDLAPHQIPPGLAGFLEVVAINRLVLHASADFPSEWAAVEAACRHIGVEPKTYIRRYRRWLRRADP